MSGTSALVVGKGNFKELSSQSKTTNGVGSAYGDGSYINMSPYQSPVNDPDFTKNNHHLLHYIHLYYPFQKHTQSVPPHYFNPYDTNIQYVLNPPANS